MTFAGAERENLLAGSRLSLAQRLEWIEEATEVARHLERQREGHSPTTPANSPTTKAGDISQRD
jgi:hypothetical protein